MMVLSQPRLHLRRVLIALSIVACCNGVGLSSARPGFSHLSIHEAVSGQHLITHEEWTSILKYEGAEDSGSSVGTVNWLEETCGGNSADCDFPLSYVGDDRCKPLNTQNCTLDCCICLNDCFIFTASMTLSGVVFLIALSVLLLVWFLRRHRRHHLHAQYIRIATKMSNSTKPDEVAQPNNKWPFMRTGTQPGPRTPSQRAETPLLTQPKWTVPGIAVPVAPPDPNATSSGSVDSGDSSPHHNIFTSSSAPPPSTIAAVFGEDNNTTASSAIPHQAPQTPVHPQQQPYRHTTLPTPSSSSTSVARKPDFSIFDSFGGYLPPVPEGAVSSHDPHTSGTSPTSDDSSTDSGYYDIYKDMNE
ncbi:hypothetical protein Pelo_11241 [Pelomyxa schiedti]|nr:hypothetical protein Pelo_11241 [Pelomyxa schiedti]